jgi:hypothetical protein
MMAMLSGERSGFRSGIPENPTELFPQMSQRMRKGRDGDETLCAHRVFFAAFAVKALSQRSPRPRAMMPRKTSRVPPWMVNLGAIRVA